MKHMAVNSKIKFMQEAIDGVVDSFRHISVKKEPAVEDGFSLSSALQRQTEKFQRRFGIQCNFTCLLETDAISRGQALAVYGIFQESLSNIARHAKATRVTTSLMARGDSLILRMCDNGIGIAGSDIINSRSGMKGIRERVRFLKGKMRIKGSPGSGTVLTVRIPYSNNKETAGEACGDWTPGNLSVRVHQNSLPEEDICYGL